MRNKQVKWPIDTVDEKISEFNGRPEKATFLTKRRLMGKGSGMRKSSPLAEIPEEGKEGDSGRCLDRC